MDGTKIEWTDATWNPVGGCSIKSPGCTNCYAQKMAGTRLAKHPLYAGTTSPSKAGPVFNGHLTIAPDYAAVWQWPLRWRGAKEPRRGAGARSMIFVGDMSDLFHEDRPDCDIDRAFAVMALAPQHDFQVLTKRAERMRQYMADLPIASAPGRIGRLLHALSAAHNGDAFKLWQAQDRLINWPLPNVMLGVSVEDQTRADERIPLLLDTPAARRFISAEPLIGPVRLRETLSSDGRGDWLASGLSGERRGLDLVIIGGESGPNARPFNIGWARDLINQCKPAGVACFVKQLGAVPIADRRPEFHASLGRDYQIYLKDKKGGDWSEWPPNLRVREFSA